MIKECPTHGMTEWSVSKVNNRTRCRICAKEAVMRWRHKTKQTLVDEAGGACSLCGYDKYLGALHFHHLDPSLKAFGLELDRITNLARLREEAKKCILVCANCHAEIEAGI